MKRFSQIAVYIILPVLLGLCLLCIVLAIVATVLSPEGLNPIEAVSIRAYLLVNDDELNSPRGADPTLQRFEVEANDTATDVGIRLVTQGFINNGTLFSRYLRYEGRDTDLREGAFFISNNMTIPQIVEISTDPTPTTATLTVIEGWRIEQIAAAIDTLSLLDFSGADFLAIVGPNAPLPPDFQAQYSIPQGVSLEGFLYPATYEIAVASTPFDLRDQMLDAFQRNVTPQMEADAIAAGWTIYEVVTLASIVERETPLQAERDTVASVYINRLNPNAEGLTRLQADPTTQYAIGASRDGNWWPQITIDDYQIQDEYNTYFIEGLPPGPIAAPSQSSIEAVINPESTQFLYFRASCSRDGSHQFALNFQQHQANAC